MPIYEFYCPTCHTVYNFFSQTIDPQRAPACPGGGDHDLERKPSRFATLSNHNEADEDELPLGIDEERLERALDQMAGEFARLDEEGEEDPKDMARLFRRFSELGGIEPGPVLEDMLARLESGADLDDVESEFEDFDDPDASLDQLFRTRKALASWRRKHPRVDETLHFF